MQNRSSTLVRNSFFAAGMAFSLILPMQAHAEVKLTAVMQSGLRVLDPELTTAFLTRDHAYMIYDTLLGMDSQF